MNPGDVQQLLFVIGPIRDRALILVLLRTGMRIGGASCVEAQRSGSQGEEDSSLGG